MIKAAANKLLPPFALALPAVGSGIVLALCFPPFAFGPLAAVALAPFLAATVRLRPSPRDAFKTGMWFGIGFNLVLLWWVIRLSPDADVTMPWILAPAVLLLVLYLALYPAAFLFGVTRISRHRFVPFLLAAPALWVLLEALRSRGELSFPWGVAGYTLSYHPVFLQLAAVIGIKGLSFVLVAVNALVAGAVALRRPAARTACAAGAVVIAVSVWAHGRASLRSLESFEGPTVKAALVQPNVDLAVKWKPEFKDSTLQLIKRHTIEAAKAGAELVVFPETAAPVYINGRDRTYRRELKELAQSLGVGLFIGFLDHRYDGPGGDLNVYNSSGLFGPDGSLQLYDKRHLLPFGERLPLSTWLRFLRKIDFGQSNFQPGPDSEPLHFQESSFIPLICFESCFPYLTRRATNDGAGYFLNVTNDTWFGNTPGPYQHAQMSIARTVENRRYLLRCGNSGVSMVVDPAGRILIERPMDVETMILTEVTALDGRTPYARYGDWPVLGGCVLLCVLGWFLARRPGAAGPRD